MPSYSLSPLFAAVVCMTIVASTGCQTTSHPSNVVATASRAQLGDTQTAPSSPAVTTVSYQEDSMHEAVATTPQQPTTDELVPAVLTVEQAVEIAISRHPALPVIDARIDALQGKWIQSGLAPNPRIGYVGEEIGDDSTLGQQGIFFSREIIRGNQLGLARATVAEEIAREQIERSVVVQRITNAAREAFYDALLAGVQVEITGRLKSDTEQIAGITQQLFEAKEVSQIAVMQTKIADQQLLREQQKAQAEWEAARNRLARVLGVPIDPSTELRGNVMPAELAPLDLELELADLLENSPEVHRAIAETARASRNLQYQCARSIPSVEYQASLRYNNASSDAVAGVQVQVPLQKCDWNQGNIQSARSEVALASNQLDLLRQQLSREFAQVSGAYQSAMVQLQRFDADILPSVEETFDLVQTGFRQGEIGYLDLLAAQQSLIDANLQVMEILREFWKARVTLQGYLIQGSTDDD